MDKNKGLADNQDGEFILNESGTSVSIDSNEKYPEDDKELNREEGDEGKEEKQEMNSSKNKI